MSKKPAFKLSLDEEAIAADPSYVINPVDAGLVLRSFIFQNRGKLYSADGQSLSAITADDIDWGDDDANGGGGGAKRRLVGSGASGKVYHAKLRGTNTPIAVKCIPISSKSHRDEVARELKFLTSKYNTEFIVANYGAFWYADEHLIAIAMEWMSYSLADLVRFSDGLPQDCARDVCFQLLRALAYLHDEKRVIHRDIKPGNILVSPKGEVKIGDFGVSAIVETLNISSTYVGTMLFMAPERLDEGSNYSFSSDVWSLGLTFIASVTGGNPWGGPRDEQMNLFQLLQRMSGGQVPTLPGAPGEKYSAEAHSFVAACLQRDPSQRPSCAELLEHPFFAGCTVESARENTLLLMAQTARLVQQAAGKGA